MKKVLFYLAYLATFAVPLYFYYQSVGAYLDGYTASVLLGVTAFVLLCNQFILASKPGFAVQALGAKGLLALHRTAPAALILIVAVHFTLKKAAGYGTTSLRALLGISAFTITLILAVFAAVIMANTVLSRIGFLAAFKKRFTEKTGMTYKKARDLHNAFVLVAYLVLVHALLASTADFGLNPAGVSWLIFWFVLSQGLYARYRLTGRGGAEKKAAQEGAAK